MLVERSAHLRKVHVRDRRVVGTARGDHHMVDRLRQTLKEQSKRVRICGVECRSFQCPNLASGLLQVLGIAASEDDPSPFDARSTAGFESDPRAATNDHDGLPSQFRLATHIHHSAPPRR